MTIEIKRVNLSKLCPEDTNNINEVLSKSPNSTVFHTIEWNKVLIDEFGLKNVTLLATIAKEPVGLYSFYVINDRLCRCPEIHLESVYGGPIAKRDYSKVTGRLLKEGEREKRTALFQIWTPPRYDIFPLLRSGYQSTEMWTTILDLHKSEEELWAGLKREKRGMIKKALKNDVHLVEGEIGLVEDYYQIAESTLSRSGKKALPINFYRRVIDELGSKGMAKFVLASHNRKFIAGVIVLLYKDTVYGWHMGSYKEYWSVAPNDFLQWEIIKWARQKGYRYYDFLRVEPDRLPGIARWKMAFRGDIVPCYLLKKATPGYQLWRVFRFVTNPRRITNRLRRLTAGRKNAN